MTTTTTKDDILNWAETIQDLLYLVPREDRAAVLAEATRIVAEDNERDPLRGMSLEEIPLCDPYRTMPLKSHVVLMFTRDITNNHSPLDADKLLFMQHRGPGSGRLLDYIGDLPSVHRRKAA